MTITSFAPVSYVNTFAPGTGLTDDALLSYCQSRIGGIDQQIDSQFHQQQGLQAGTTAANNVSNSFAQGIAPSQGITFGALNYCVGQIQGALAQMDPTDPQAQALQAQLNALLPIQSKYSAQFAVPPTQAQSQTTVINADDCKTYSDTFGNIGKDTQSEAEMQMMTLQSLVTQRQTAVQMCTSMLSSLGDTQKSVAEKIGT